MRDLTNTCAVLDDEIPETLGGVGKPLRNGELKGADYAADLALEAMEGHFEERSRKPATAPIPKRQDAGREIAIELAGLWTRRSIGWLEVTWRVARAQSLAAAAAQQLRGMSDALRDCRETGERIKARFAG